MSTDPMTPRGETPPRGDEPPPPVDSSAPPEIPSTQDDRTMALICHLGGALGSFIVPLIVWLIKKDQSRFVDDQGKEALNFQLTLLIGHVIGMATACFTFGMVNAAVGVVGLIFGILGGLEANKGVAYRYPLNIRFIK
ncbi:MAG TPA: DUF4870 domain-containing protein [Gemmataceae bacterium]|nr:DUF4870 domain-containing protein [Gemmataceae bacterium]